MATVSGTVTLDSSSVEGAYVIVSSSASDDPTDDPQLEGVATTDAQGEWSLVVADGRTVWAQAAHESGEDQYTALGRVFVSTPEASSAFVDDFDRADQSLSASADWVDVEGSLAIVNTKLQVGATGSFQLARLDDGVGILGGDQYAQADVTSLVDGSGTRNAYVAARVSDADNYYIAIFRADGTWLLRKRSGGTNTTLDSGVYSHSPPHTIRLSVVAGRVRFYIDDLVTPVADETDGTPLSGGTPGVAMFVHSGEPTSTVEIDSFEADAI